MSWEFPTGGWLARVVRYLGRFGVLFLIFLVGYGVGGWVSQWWFIPRWAKERVKEASERIGETSGELFVPLGLAGTTVPFLAFLPGARLLAGAGREAVWVFRNQGQGWMAERAVKLGAGVTGGAMVAGGFVLGSFGEGLVYLPAEAGRPRRLARGPVHVYQMAVLGGSLCSVLVASWEGVWCVEESTEGPEVKPVMAGFRATGIAVNPATQRVYWAGSDGRVFGAGLGHGPEGGWGFVQVEEFDTLSPGVTSLCWWASEDVLLAGQWGRSYVLRGAAWVRWTASRGGSERDLRLLACPQGGSERAWVVDASWDSRRAWFGLVSMGGEARWWSTQELFIPVTALEDGVGQGTVILGTMGRGFVQFHGLSQGVK